MMNNKPNKPPLGVFTVALFSLALAYSAYDYFSPKPPCEQLTLSLSKGYFMQWMGDRLLLLTSDKQQYQVMAHTQQQGCEAMILELEKSAKNGY